ncbi:haloacid dehalogenase superfamily, subfamily IA, variant 1 with third motif having Dx(3-4)D or Dx(3-4)E [Pseudobutyrivibrio sp. 49]|uniref:HAD-IA family hydrolase n=1 Tax=Pseudobutyrivibrio sp. 49 TaxID=1855344 RepID=UPI00087ECC48|nr:HAD-IA family hydrolase [Pseudobutyrivibrio sp. 49]SDH59164.1 haloacid dehalogenase superfamily, subfamily IA, variant 1 with third motif having Dx(3-4)D or Dx(3-4)E [Pseudobutyrivibrio sp. 49]
MQEIHILFTGVGRRIELLKAFRQAALCLKVNLKIYGADMAGTAPALAYCDFTRRVCGMKEPQYIDELLEICKADNIDLLIPTIDTDLLVLSQNAGRFDEIGTKVLISKPDKIAICRDKNNTGEFFESCGLKAPKTYNDYRKYDNKFPCFIKPKDGSSSINAFKVEDAQELEVYAHQVEDYIIQPFVSGREYTIDIFCDFDGNPIFITPRERLQVRAGEVLKTQIHMDSVMIEESKKLIADFKPCGPMTVQLIQDEVTGENYYIEINPRYGGGAPLSMKAGARSAEAVLRLLCGESVGYFDGVIEDDAIYSRFDDSVCISSGKDAQLRGIIFDLDDTLYGEKEYVRSGYKKIEEYLGIAGAADKLWEYFSQGKAAIDCYLESVGMLDTKDECLKVYREQMPDIHFYSGVKDRLIALRESGIKLGIITDGRVEGQKNKIKALGLEELVDDIIITDELGGVQFRKPNDISFRIMQNRWRMPFENIMYVGDNLSKDCQAPKQLGMKFKWFRNEDGLYFVDVEAKDEDIYNW